MHERATDSPAIGVFDSGVGGLSVLRALHRQRPDLPLHYVADSGHAPYGDRSPSHVINRSLRVADHLIAEGAALIVVACNTATAYAIEALRQRHPNLPLVGVEPGVKPAAALSHTGHVAVLATPGTLASLRFQTLVGRHAPQCQVHAVPCAGLAAAIEQGQDGESEVKRLLDRYVLPLRDTAVDTVVLGCTHYPFVATEIAERLKPGVRLLDTADPVAQQTLRLWAPTEAGESPRQAWPGLRLQTTGDPAVLNALAHRGLGLTAQAERIRI